MCEAIILNKKFLKFLLVFGILSSIPIIVLAQSPTVQILGESTTNPSPGTTMYVTVSVCDSFTYNSNPDIRPKLMAAIISGSGQTAFNSTCTAPGQHLVVDNNIAGNIASGPGMYDPDTGNNAQGVGGPPVYPNINVVANASCASNAVTAIWPIYIDGSVLSPGNYSFVVIAAEDYITCGTSPYSSASFNFSVPLPPPNCTVTKSAAATTAAPDSLILFNIDYTFVNTSDFTITDTVPSGTSFVTMGPGGTQSGNNISWDLGAATTQQSGAVWLLVRVNPGTANGTVITNSAIGNAVGAAAPVTGTASSMVQVPQLTLTKSESATSVAANSNITYTLDWTASGQNLQLYDSYDNDTSGTTNGSVVGFDGTPYNYVNTGGMGGFTVQTNALVDGLNNYIQGCAYSSCNSPTTVNNFPTLLRSGPAVNLCDTFTVEGDLEIPAFPVTMAPGADSTMIIAENTAPGGTYDAYMIGISWDCGPGNLFLQKNDSSTGSVTWPVKPCDSSIGVSIVPGVWFTVKVLVTPTGTGLNFQAKVWPVGTPEPAAWSINYTDPTPLPCIPRNGGTYMIGWQADGTSSTDYFTNLKLFGPGPIVGSTITDAVPSGISYVGSNTTPSSGPSPLVWNNPATLFTLNAPIQWWGQVPCPGPYNNQFTMSANGIPAVTSNTVSASVTGSCITSTPTNTPTITPSPTPTPSMVSSFGCFALSGDGKDAIISDVGGWASPAPASAVVVTDVTTAAPMDWPNACGGQWISDNANAFALQSTPATMVFQRTFSISSAIISSGSFAITFGADDSAYYVLSNSLYPAGVTIASTFSKNCQGQAFSGSLLTSSGPNTLTSYLINTTSIPTGVGSNYGFTGLYYELCVMGNTPTPTSTPTNTPTPTITSTPLATPTATPTPAGLHVWPNPFNPQYAWPGNGAGLFRAYMVPPNATMSIYTISGELVIKLGQDPDYPGYIDWNGENKKGIPVSGGVYYYVIQNNNSNLLSGKVLVLRD
jgi:hypothetical protein